MWKCNILKVMQQMVEWCEWNGSRGTQFLLLGIISILRCTNPLTITSHQKCCSLQGISITMITGTSHDIWFDQILKKIWKSQYLCHFWTFGLIWYHKCHFQTIWYNFVITNIIFNIFGKYLYLVLSLHWYLMQFKSFFVAKLIKIE